MMDSIIKKIAEYPILIVLTVWVVCYLVWMLVLPDAWVDSVQSLLFKGRMPFEHARPFGT